MKRSSSAPLIPDLIQTEIKTPLPSSNLLSRRGLSNSNVSLPGEILIRNMGLEGSPRVQPLASPLPLSRINSPTSRHRVEQLKKEENIDERRNEKEVQEQIMLNKNCDELRLDSDDQDFRMEVWTSQPSPLHQPLSPLASRMMRSRSLTPTSPNSARSFSRRSCSPVLRPSSLCFQVGRKRARDYDSQDDMDTSPSAPCKRLQYGISSPLNLSPSVSPLTPLHLHHSFSASHSRKSSSNQSESTPLSSPSSLLHSTNPFAVNYDSGNCEHWQSNSGSGSNCSSGVQSPSVIYINNNQRGETISSSSSSNSRTQGNLSLDEIHGSSFPTHHHSHSQLTPSPVISINEDNYRGSMDTGSIEISTETPTPLSPKGLQFRQKLFPPQNLPSPIPRPHPHSTSSISSTRGPSITPGSPKSHYQHTTSLQHDKHLSPFKSDLPPGRLIRTVTKTRLNHSLRTSTTSSGGSGEHFAGGMSRFVSSNSNRQTISSPLAKLSMSSTIEDGNTITLRSSSMSPAKRRTSETSVDSREDSIMESDNESGGLEESLETCHNARRKPFEDEVLQT